MADDPPVRVIWSPRGKRAEVRPLRCQVFEISPRACGGFRARPTSARAILQAANVVGMSGSGTVMPRTFAVLRFRMSIYLSGR
jgi:hypothetical protein